TFAGETPMCTCDEKEDLDGEPKGEEEDVRQHDPAPSRRNLLKHLSNNRENQQSGRDRAGPQPVQRLWLDRWLKKLGCRRLRPSRHGCSSGLRQDLNAILIQKTKVGRAQ